MEFKIKWAREVNSKGPLEGIELSHLKDSVPKEASDKMFETEDLKTAWMILDDLYGDRKLIGQKLKMKLKALKPKSLEDYKKIIELNEE